MKNPPRQSSSHWRLDKRKRKTLWYVAAKGGDGKRIKDWVVIGLRLIHDWFVIALRLIRDWVVDIEGEENFMGPEFEE